MFHQVWETFFNFMVFTFLEDALNLWIFTHALVSQVSPKTKRVEETIICFIQIQSENIKMTWNINLFKLFYFLCLICSFFKCDGSTVLWIISIKSVILHLLSLICNHGNFTLKLYASEKKTRYLNDGWPFIDRFKVGSLPRMKNKEVLAQFICKPS